VESNARAGGEREISDVALLDLTGAQACSALDSVTRISHVAAILVPESLVAKLSSIPMDRIAATVPVRDGTRPKIMSGQIVMRGGALGNAGNHDKAEMLVIAGQLIITSPVTHMGYKELVVLGQLVARVGSEPALGAALTRLTGQVV
jgi:hypothetical protein